MELLDFSREFDLLPHGSLREKKKKIWNEQGTLQVN